MTNVPEPQATRRHSRWLPRFLQPPPPAKQIVAEPAEIQRLFGAYQIRILVWTTVGYAAFYIVRKNLSVPQPVMEKELDIDIEVLGMFLSAHGVLYGISKFVNGFLGDRANGRVFMALGLILSALMNIGFGLSSSAVMLGSFWMLNGWFQGMGYPPCARLLTHWFSPNQVVTRMAIWNVSHNVGAAAAGLLGGWLLTNDFSWLPDGLRTLLPSSWRLCFFVPAVIAAVASVMLLLWLRDTPESVGLPEAEGTFVKRPSNDAPPLSGTSDEDFRRVLKEKVFGNPYIWVLSLANFFVYTIRYGIFDWAPTFLTKVKGVNLGQASWMVAGYEIAGIAGALVFGWLTDRWFGGRPARMCLFCMLLCAAALYLFHKAPAGDMWLNSSLLLVAGFAIYGPQGLIGTAAANLATKRAAATAVGLTGIFGYASTLVSGWGIGRLVKYYGWDVGIYSLIVVAGVAVVLFVIAWPAKAHGYDE